MDKESGRSLADYAKSVQKVIERITPWTKAASRRGEHLRGKVKPGETVVLLGGGDRVDNPLYKGAKVARE